MAEQFIPCDTLDQHTTSNSSNGTIDHDQSIDQLASNISQTRHVSIPSSSDDSCGEALDLVVTKTSAMSTTPEPHTARSSSGRPWSVSSSPTNPGLKDESASSSAIAAAAAAAEDSSRERRRRQKLTNKDNLFCAVCGDKANGYNFGAITCESCKAFFRRNALKNKDLKCNFEQSCKIDHFTRKFCTACRLQKCFDADMKKEWILDEDALKKRKKLTRKSKEEQAVFDARIVRETGGHSSMAPDSTLTLHSDQSSGDFLMSGEDPDYPPIPLSEEEQAEITRIMANHMSCVDDGKPKIPTGEAATAAPESTPSPEDTKNKAIPDRNYHADQTEFAQLSDQPAQPTELFNMADGFVRRLIKFVKALPEYRNLPQEDQIALLKGCIMETMVLRSAIMYDPNIKGFQVEEQNSKQRKDLKMTFIQEALGDEIYSEHMKFVTSFNSVARWDKPTMVLAMIINLFSSDRPGLVNKPLVAKAEERYSLLLQAYLRSKYSFYEARSIYPKLLLKLTDVRSYGDLSSQMVQDFTPGDNLAPLLAEVFSMNAV